MGRRQTQELPGGHRRRRLKRSAGAFSRVQQRQTGPRAVLVNPSTEGFEQRLRAKFHAQAVYHPRRKPVDNRPPRRFNHLRRRLKRRQMQEDEQARIDAENIRLLQQLVVRLVVCRHLDPSFRSSHTPACVRQTIGATQSVKPVVARVGGTQAVTVPTLAVTAGRPPRVDHCLALNAWGRGTARFVPSLHDAGRRERLRQIHVQNQQMIAALKRAKPSVPRPPRPASARSSRRTYAQPRRPRRQSARPTRRPASRRNSVESQSLSTTSFTSAGLSLDESSSDSDGRSPVESPPWQAVFLRRGSNASSCEVDATEARAPSASPTASDEEPSRGPEPDRSASDSVHPFRKRRRSAPRSEATNSPLSPGRQYSLLEGGSPGLRRHDHSPRHLAPAPHNESPAAMHDEGAAEASQPGARTVYAPPPRDHSRPRAIQRPRSASRAGVQRPKSARRGRAHQPDERQDASQAATPLGIGYAVGASGVQTAVDADPDGADMLIAEDPPTAGTHVQFFSGGHTVNVADEMQREAGSATSPSRSRGPLGMMPTESEEDSPAAAAAAGRGSPPTASDHRLPSEDRDAVVSQSDGHTVHSFSFRNAVRTSGTDGQVLLLPEQSGCPLPPPTSPTLPMPPTAPCESPAPPPPEPFFDFDPSECRPPAEALWSDAGAPLAGLDDHDGVLLSSAPSAFPSSMPTDPTAAWEDAQELGPARLSAKRSFLRHGSPLPVVPEASSSDGSYKSVGSFESVHSYNGDVSSPAKRLFPDEGDAAPPPASRGVRDRNDAPASRRRVRGGRGGGAASTSTHKAKRPAKRPANHTANRSATRPKRRGGEGKRVGEGTQSRGGRAKKPPRSPCKNVRSRA